MKTTIEEEGKEGDEPIIEEFDEEKENEETKKKMKKEKEVFHEWEHLNMNKLLKVVDVPVVQVVIYRGLSSCENASDSVHRRILWTFQFATETGTHSANCAAGSLVRRMAVEAAMRAFLALGHFSRSSRYLERLGGGGDAGSLVLPQGCTINPSSCVDICMTRRQFLTLVGELAGEAMCQPETRTER